jgi:hypothetical protein
MTIAPDRELEELDFPTPEIEHDGNLLLVPQERITVGPIVFTPTEHKAICWDCDKPHDGEVGRCPECAEAFGRARLAAPTLLPDPTPGRIADELQEAFRRTVEERTFHRYSPYQDRDWYCYCSPTRYQRLTNSREGSYSGGSTLARDYERRAREDALRARQLEAEYHDRLAQELQSANLTMRAHTWLTGDEQAVALAKDAPGRGGGFHWRAGLAGTITGLVLGALLALLVL